MSTSAVGLARETNGNGRKRWLTAETVLLAVLTLAGGLGNYFVLSYRIGELEKRYEAEVVPRQEHNVRDQALYGKIDLMQHSLDQMNDRLTRIGESLERRR
jgi:hypothetical protein